MPNKAQVLIESNGLTLGNGYLQSHRSNVEDLVQLESFN